MSAKPPVWPPSGRGLALLGVLLAACPAGNDDDSAVPEDDPWIAEQEGLPGAALSIWGAHSDDVWVVGTGGDVSEPLVLHLSDGDWEQLDTGESGQAWWVVGDDERLFVVGSDGLLLRSDRSGSTWERLPTNTEATLFGAWIAPSGRLWAVGGVIGSSTEGPVLLQLEGDVVTEVTGLPPGISDDENFFKVWGSADDDVWVISDLGTALHFDGLDWGRQILPEAPRLVTIHGSGADDIAVVGGASTARLYELDGVLWNDSSPAGGQPLNGVFLTADGGGFAAGFGNFLLERSGGVWTSVDGSPRVAADWHGVWLDEAGEPWLVGGNLLGLDRGMVARRVTP